MWPIFFSTTFLATVFGTLPSLYAANLFCSNLFAFFNLDSSLSLDREDRSFFDFFSGLGVVEEVVL